MGHRFARIAAAVVTLGLVFPTNALAGPVTVASLFDGDLEGWTSSDSLGSFVHKAAGGNPGGFAEHDNSESELAILLAPAAFLGDLSAFIGGTFAFDGNMLGGGGTFFDGPNGIPGGVYDDYGTLEVQGVSTTARVDMLPSGATPPLQSWQTFSVALTPESFNMSESDFATLMGTVTSLRLNIEGLWGPEIQGIDNVRLMSSDTGATPVSEPAASQLFVMGLASLLVIRFLRPGALT